MGTGGSSARDDDGRALILRKANLSFGGKVSVIQLGDFLSAGKAGPEHQALNRVIGSLVEKRLIPAVHPDTRHQSPIRPGLVS
jgi:hypothetical protein